MNEDYKKIKRILADLRSEYADLCSNDLMDPNTPITERDIVAEIYYRLKLFCKKKKLYPHTEIKPASRNFSIDELKKLPRIDVVILKNNGHLSWLSAATKIQNRYKKGMVEARFSSVPINFFHTAIEVKIQSNVRSAKKDLDTLSGIMKKKKSCNCFMVLLNARGPRKDHEKIIKYAQEKKIHLIEYTFNRHF